PDATDKNILAGQELFASTGCASCHRPSWETGDSESAALANQTIYPYTDMLLHDMGKGLADNRPEFQASGREWRTAPLWGLGDYEDVNGHTQLLHDGRARNITEAILWHGGEATSSRDNFIQLPREKKQLLLNFLKSL
ncbi:MAG: di-heme oxidoredictase family protein, partial [Gammaproteobacteria bacterium]